MPARLPFESSDVAYFVSTARQIESLLGNAPLIAQLELERNQLSRVNAELEDRDTALRMAAEQLRTANEGLAQRVQERTVESAAREPRGAPSKQRRATLWPRRHRPNVDWDRFELSTYL